MPSALTPRRFLATLTAIILAAVMLHPFTSLANVTRSPALEPTRTARAFSESTPDCDVFGTPANTGHSETSSPLQISLEASEIMLGTDSVTLLVTNQQGEPVSNAMVYITIRMPAMDHGESAYPAAEIGEGWYRATDVSLGMVGEWIVRAEVIRTGRSPSSETFRLNVSN